MLSSIANVHRAECLREAQDGASHEGLDPNHISDEEMLSDSEDDEESREQDSETEEETEEVEERKGADEANVDEADEIIEDEAAEDTEEQGVLEERAVTRSRPKNITKNPLRLTAPVHNESVAH